MGGRLWRGNLSISGEDRSWLQALPGAATVKAQSPVKQGVSLACERYVPLLVYRLYSAHPTFLLQQVLCTVLSSHLSQPRNNFNFLNTQGCHEDRSFSSLRSSINRRDPWKPTIYKSRSRRRLWPKATVSHAICGKE